MNLTADGKKLTLCDSPPVSSSSRGCWCSSWIEVSQHLAGTPGAVVWVGRLFSVAPDVGRFWLSASVIRPNYGTLHLGLSCFDLSSTNPPQRKTAVLLGLPSFYLVRSPHSHPWLIISV